MRLGIGTVVASATVAVADDGALVQVTICPCESVVLSAPSSGRDEPLAQLDIDP